MTNRIVPSGRSMHLPLAVGGGEQSLSEHEEYQSGDHDAKTGELPPFGRAHRHLNQAETVYDHTRCELSDDEQEHHIGYAQLWCEKYRCEDKACTKDATKPTPPWLLGNIAANAVPISHSECRGSKTESADGERNEGGDDRLTTDARAQPAIDRCLQGEANTSSKCHQGVKNAIQLCVL